MSDAVAAECIHGLTVDWCSICKADGITRRKVRKRKRNIDSWTTTLPLPNTLAAFPSTCPFCEGDLDVGEPVYLIEGLGWVDEDCAIAHLDDGGA